jgi:16S rRNA (cytidine1402-2'-O)-methyltransferase
LTALTVSALPTDRFLFIGFPPPRTSARKQVFQEVAEVRASIVIFESARRLAGSLADMRDTLGDRDAVVAREMTKRFEETKRGTLSELALHYSRVGAPKGEIVIVVGPPGEPPPPPEEAIDTLIRETLPGRTLRDTVDLVAGKLDLPRRTVYERALAIKNGPNK